MRSNRRLVGLIMPMIFLILSCHQVKKEVPDTMVTGKATITADEALLPVMNAELDVFHSIYEYASIECKYLSEYDAVNLLLQEQVRLAIVARPLNQKETDFLKSKNILPESIPLGYDAIALVVHADNPIKAMTTSQVGQILSGAITDWGQIEKSKKVGAIRQVFDMESSGIIRSLNDSLHLNKKISGNICFAGSNEKVIEMVAANPDVIGFIGYNWLSENESLKVQEITKKLSLVALSKASFVDSTNCYKPSIASIYNARYPLIRRIYAIYTDPSASLARGFLAHLTCERGQKIIYRSGLKPAIDFQRLVKIKKDY